jgi:hypothetical protein
LVQILLHFPLILKLLEQEQELVLQVLQRLLELLQVLKRHQLLQLLHHMLFH